MKTNFSITVLGGILLLLLTLNLSCKKFDPSNYYDELSNYYNLADDIISQFYDDLHDSTITIEDFEAIYESDLNKLKQNYKTFKKNVVKKENILYPSIDNFLSQSIKIFKNEGKEIVDILKNDPSLSNEESIEKLDNAEKQFIDKMIALEDNTSKAAHKYADKYNIVLIHKNE